MEQQEDGSDSARAAILAAAPGHVAFDGWSDASLQAAIAESGVAPGLAQALFPRGAIDLAHFYHLEGDRRMAEAMASRDLAALRYRDRVTLAVRLRLEGTDPEAVRHGSALFALPHHAPEGAGLIWGTADAIWTTLGDTSRDVNWYSKRATLSAVYGSVVLYWLNDISENRAQTWEFLDRRIDNVMQFERLKARFRKNPLGKALIAGPLKILERISAPQGRGDLPGHCKTQTL
jgi:ubiquinone biosynthesis protein COQ9